VAEIERPVRKVMLDAIVTIRSVLTRPTLPTTQPIRRYMITPNIVRILGRYTPLNVPNRCGSFLPSDAGGHGISLVSGPTLCLQI
jgi:hypothetical protein